MEREGHVIVLGQQLSDIDVLGDGLLNDWKRG